MVIPTSTLRKQLKTPNVSRGQVEGAADLVKEAFAPAISTVKAIESAGNAMAKFKMAEKKADDDRKANDAYTYLVEGLTNEFTAFTQQKGSDAKKYYDKTLPEKTGSIDQLFKNTINGIDDYEIRESVRRQANNFKLNLNEKIEAHRYTQESLAATSSADRKIATFKKEAEFEATDSAEENIAILRNKSTSIVGQIATTAAYTGDHDGALQIQKAQKHNNEMVGLIYKKMVGLSYNNGFGQAYLEAKIFLKNAYDEGLIDAATYQSYAHKAAEEELKMEIKRNPGFFVKDGAVDQSLIDALSGDMLSPWERTQIVESVQAELNGKGPLSEEGKLMLEEEEYAQSALIEQEFAKAGLYSKEYYTTLQVAQGKKPQDMAEIKHAHYKNVDPIAVFKLYDLLDAQSSRLVNIEGKNRRVITKELRDAREAALDYIQYFVENYDGELVAQSRRTGIPGLIEKTARSAVLPGRKFTADEAGLHKFIENFRVDLDKGLGELGPKTANNYYDVANAYVKYIRSLKKAGIDSTKPIEGNYDDAASQQKIMAAYADAVLENNMAINSVADETFVEGVMTNNFTPNPWAIAREVSDFFGQDTNINTTYNMPVIFEPARASAMLQQKFEAEKILRKREKDRIDYVARQIEMRQKAEEEYNKKMIEEQKKRQKLIEGAKK